MKHILEFKIGLLLSLLTLIFGFGLGIAFGISEDSMKKSLKIKADEVFVEAYSGDVVKQKKILDKSWAYHKRAHLHANGLGTTSLALIFLLAVCTKVNFRWRWITSIALGIGSLGYSVFWLLAGSIAPSMGSTGAAKHSLDWLAMPTSGLCVLGLLSVFVILLITPKSSDSKT